MFRLALFSSLNMFKIYSASQRWIYNGLTISGVSLTASLMLHDRLCKSACMKQTGQPNCLMPGLMLCCEAAVLALGASIDLIV